jgi:polyhydroxybutyrate depolymerase
MMVYPDGLLGSSNQQGWNDCRLDAGTNPDSDDVSFLSHLATDIAKKYSIDLQSLFVTGMSNGGHMSIRLALESPDIFKGVAAISAAVSANSGCRVTSHTSSVLMVNGTADKICPVSGGSMAGNRGKILSAEEGLAMLLKMNSIPKAANSSPYPEVTNDDQSSATKYSYPIGNLNRRIEYIEILGGGHTEPSIKEIYGQIFLKLVGPQNRDIEMAEIVWTFFSSLQ